MAKVPSVRRITIDAIGGAIPTWFSEGVLYILNLLIDSQVTSLDKGLTVAENMNAQVKELTFTTSSTYTGGDWTTIKFKHSLFGKASGVSIAQIWVKDDRSLVIKSATTLDWTEENGQIKVRYISGLNNSLTYTVRLHVWQ